jgi:hypothetical protein
MDRVARRGLVTVMVAGGVLASAGYAQADSGAAATAAGSPGVLSGNTVQVPLDVPVNVCGNTVDVVGLLNPVFGTSCADTSSHAGQPAGGSTAAAGGSRHVLDGAQAAARSAGSPGVVAGNTLALPVHAPVNVSGNSVNVVGIGNPAHGTTSVNGPATPPPPAHLPVPAPPNEPAPAAGEPTEAAAAAPELAHTGASGLGLAGAASAALLLGGSVLYRRARAAGRR